MHKHDPIGRIITRVAEQFGVEVQAIVGPSRMRHLCDARAVAAWAIRTCLPAVSLVAIGQRLGGRDHTTIMHAIERTTNRIGHEPAYAAALSALINELAASLPEPLLVQRSPAHTPARAGEAWWAASLPWRPLAA
jgi:chromosomal replication initiator protein